MVGRGGVGEGDAVTAVRMKGIDKASYEGTKGRWNSVTRRHRVRRVKVRTSSIDRLVNLVPDFSVSGNYYYFFFFFV